MSHATQGKQPRPREPTNTKLLQTAGSREDRPETKGRVMARGLARQHLDTCG